MMRKIITATTFTFLACSITQAQTVQKIGDNPTEINKTAVLEVASTTKGFLPPRMTTADRNAITTPANGLVIYNTDTKKLEVFDGTSWYSVGGSNNLGNHITPFIHHYVVNPSTQYYINGNENTNLVINAISRDATISLSDFTRVPYSPGIQITIKNKGPNSVNFKPDLNTFHYFEVDNTTYYNPDKFVIAAGTTVTLIGGNNANIWHTF